MAFRYNIAGSVHRQRALSPLPPPPDPLLRPRRPRIPPPSVPLPSSAQQHTASASASASLATESQLFAATNVKGQPDVTHPPESLSHQHSTLFLRTARQHEASTRTTHGEERRRNQEQRGKGGHQFARRKERLDEERVVTLTFGAEPHHCRPPPTFVVSDQLAWPPQSHSSLRPFADAALSRHSRQKGFCHK
eukprot:2976440-Rhodomonas_salina.1